MCSRITLYDLGLKLRVVSALNRITDNPQPNQFGRSLEYPMFEKIAPHIPFPGNVILSNLWFFGPVVSRLAKYSNILNAFVRTTTAITVVKAGYKDNVIPVSSSGKAFLIHNLNIYI